MAPPRQLFNRWFQFGAVAGFASAVLYTAANVQLRRSVGVDPFLVAAVKSVPTTLGIVPAVLWMLARRQPLATDYSMATRFAAVALLGQFVGNAAFQVALEHITLAVAVPITLGTLIIGGGLLGWRYLGEPIGRARAVSMVLLITAVGVLSMGDNQTNASVTGEQATGPPVVWWGAACAVASGAAYSLFGVTMRRTLQSGMSLPVTMLISGVVGMVSLWGYCGVRLGTAYFHTITDHQWWVMSTAGAFNFAAFAALSAALQRLPVVAVNLINASQVAMATLAGVWLFDESLNGSVYAGVLLTVAGLLVLTAGRR